MRFVHQRRDNGSGENGDCADKKADSCPRCSPSKCSQIRELMVGTKAPDVCPVCKHPQAYFEVRKENY